MGLGEVFPDYDELAARGFTGIVCAKPSIMVAMTPRTGSTHLCAALHAAGQQFEPNEIFNPRGPAMQERKRRVAEDFENYMAAFAAGPDKTFIFKTGWYDAAPLAPYLRRLFPDLRVIYLSRRNDAAQAVSSFKAGLTGRYHSRFDEQPPPAVLDEQFSMPRLLAVHRTHERERQSWEAWFASQQIIPLRLAYEDFEADVNRALQRLVPALDLGLRTEIPPGTGLRKLADGVSALWTERLLKHLLNLS